MVPLQAVSRHPAGTVSGHRAASASDLGAPRCQLPSHVLSVDPSAGGKVALPGLEGALTPAIASALQHAKPGVLRRLGWVVSESPVCKIRTGTVPG